MSKMKLFPNGTEPRVFISYATEDDEKASRLHVALSSRGVRSWKADRSLLPGERWEDRICDSLEKSDFFICCLSAASVQKIGYIQTEIAEAIRLSKLRPRTKVFIIPIRFEPCDVPRELTELQWANLFEDFAQGVSDILAVITKYWLPEAKARELESLVSEAYEAVKDDNETYEYLKILYPDTSRIIPYDVYSQLETRPLFRMHLVEINGESRITHDDYVKNWDMCAELTDLGRLVFEKLKRSR